MPVEQRQFLQLIGEWGYDPEDLLHHVEGMAETAHNINDFVGEAAYLTIASVCIYALTNDAKRAVSCQDVKRPSTNQKAFTGIRASLVSKVLKFAVAKAELPSVDDYSNLVLEATYEKISKYTDLHGAVIYLRQGLFHSLTEIVIKHIIRIADEVGGAVMEMMTCMVYAKYGKDSGQAVDYYFNPLAAKAFDSITEKLIKRKVALLELPSFIEPEFSDLTNVITEFFYDGLGARIDALNVKILNAPNMKPHEIAAFRSNYSHVMAAFLVGIAIGVFDYADYQDLMAAKNIVNGPVSTDDVENIERMRNN